MKRENGYLVWTKGEDGLASYHFKLGEFECPCSHADCKEQRLSEELVQRLEALRVEWDGPLQVNSGFRCKRHQAELAARPGVETVAQGNTSQHELGNAADIAPRHGMPRLSVMAAKYFKAIGTGRSFVHVDLRADKTRRWGYSY